MLYNIFTYLRSNWLSLSFFGFAFFYVIWQRLPQYLSDRQLMSRPVVNFEIKKTSALMEREQVSQPSLRGKKVLLYFFATWCGSCHFQLSSIQKIQKELYGPEFTVLAISEEKADTLEQYRKKEKISFPLYIDTNSRLHQQFQVRSYPTMVWLETRDGAKNQSQNGNQAEIVDIDRGLDLFLPYTVRYWVKNSFL